jgi:organic hydroperoxide reductase OsmC/OhrA
MSVEAAVDPEEAFVASLSSCHMLWFLSIAAKRGFLVDHYRDEAIGVMKEDSSGKLAMTLVTLYPDVQFGSDQRPTAETLIAMHREAHEQCYIARSVKAEVRCEPVGIE